jgi:hypothetical protein
MATTTTTSRTGTALPSVYLSDDKDSYLGWVLIIIKTNQRRSVDGLGSGGRLERETYEHSLP